MRRPLALAIFLLTLLFESPLDAATFRMALIVGNNEGTSGRLSLRYAEQDARNLHRALVQLGGFPESQTRLLLGKNAGTVEAAMDSLKTQAIHLARNPGDRILFLFYFSGHSEGGFLETGLNAIEFHGVRDALRRLPASTRILILDSCHSGGMIRAKGGIPAPPFALAPEEGGGLPQGEVLIASSTEIEESLESSELQGSFFTHHLVSGLRGGADFNHDGRGSLPEAFSYA